MSHPLEPILLQLSEKMNSPLHVDIHGVCKMRTQEGIELQLEYSDRDDRLICIAFVGKLDDAPFRTRIFQDLMTSNSLPDQPRGIFGFYAKNNLVTLHTFVSPEELASTDLASLLRALADKALLWRPVLEQGRPAPIPTQTATFKPTPGMIRP